MIRLRRRGALFATGSLFVAACAASRGSGLTSTAPIQVKPLPTPIPATYPPVRLPADEAPHDVLAEWWYYTGHLFTGPQAAGVGGGEYGFELVFFRGVRGSRPPGYSAHFAVTDTTKQQYHFAQLQDVALNETARPQPRVPGRANRPTGVVSAGPAEGGFDLALGGWSIRGQNGQDDLRATMPDYGIDVSLSATRPPALHLGQPPLFPGLISFGPAGYSYYYSRTRMALSGALLLNGQRVPVTGQAWMDHQWGDFLVLGGGGWDWFSAQLADGRDLTFSIVRDERGANILAYGTLVDTSGEYRHLEPSSFQVQALDTWTSPHSGVRYPSGWRLQLPGESLDATLTPLMEDQEFDARASTGVVYWEGAVSIRDTRTSADLGRGYVELTGYTAAR